MIIGRTKLIVQNRMPSTTSTVVQMLQQSPKARVIMLSSITRGVHVLVVHNNRSVLHFILPRPRPDAISMRTEYKTRQTLLFADPFLCSETRRVRSLVKCKVCGKFVMQFTIERWEKWRWTFCWIVIAEAKTPH